MKILRSEDEDKFEQAFGENSVLFPDFLEAAQERRRNGIEEKKPRSRSIPKKRSRNEEEDAVPDTMPDGGYEQDQPSIKRPHVEYVAAGQQQEHQQEQQLQHQHQQHPQQHQQQQQPMAEGDFQAQMTYEHDIANAQQVARDLHSWRQQGNYWK